MTLSQALENLISAYGRRSWCTSELLPPEQQDGEIADGMRALLDNGGDQSNSADAADTPLAFKIGELKTTLPDDGLRGRFEARQAPGVPWLWEVWDVTHPAEGNHFPVIHVNSNGASEDFHEQYARTCAAALSSDTALQGGSANSKSDASPTRGVDGE